MLTTFEEQYLYEKWSFKSENNAGTLQNRHLQNTSGTAAKNNQNTVQNLRKSVDLYIQ